LQSVLSASQQDLLKAKLKQYGIDKYFYNIIGLENHYAESKIAKGKAWMVKLNLQPQEVLLIGDTIHDYDVARYIGCDFLLERESKESILSTFDLRVIEKYFPEYEQEIKK